MAENSNNPYSFALRPEEHQPSGVCDFRKIYNPKNFMIQGGDGKWYPMEQRVQVNKKGKKKVTHIIDLDKLNEMEKNAKQA